MLRDPTSFGYERCLTHPVLQDNADLRHFHFVSVLSSRAHRSGHHKFLFILVDDNRAKVVLKCFTNSAAAKREFSILQRVQQIDNVVGLRCSTCVKVIVQYVPDDGRDYERVECTGFLLEHCRPLAPSEALPVHVAKIGLALSGIASLSIFHNDISPDNLMTSMETQQPVICDFDMATQDQEFVNPDGSFSGKYLFAPCVAYDAAKSDGKFCKRCGSFVADLESLLYTAYALAHGGAIWSSSDFDPTIPSGRNGACGYHTRRNIMLPDETIDKWEPFLDRMSAAFGKDEEEEADVASMLAIFSDVIAAAVA
jgi:serine/threonine protein kinase